MAIPLTLSIHAAPQTQPPVVCSIHRNQCVGIEDVTACFAAGPRVTAPVHHEFLKTGTL